MPVNFEHLRTRLKIEQARLLNWGEQVGLAEELLENPSRTLRFNQNLILDILVQIQAAFQRCVKIEARFGEKLQKNGMSASSTVKDPKSFLRKTLAVLEKPTRAAASLQWAMIKENDFKTLIIRLIEYNDAIWSLLDRRAMEDLRLMQHESNLIMLQLAEQISELRNITAAQAIRPHGERNEPSQSISRSTTLAGYEPAHDAILGALAEFKARHMSIAEGENLSRKLLIPQSDLPEAFGQADPSVPFDYKGRKTWVEWREPVDEDLSRELLNMLDHRIQKLANLLSDPMKPKEFRAPQCIGYVYKGTDGEEPCCGFVYDVPGPQSSHLRINSLRQLFLTRPTPSLTKRIGLASMVTESLFYLHAVNWLHKGLRSKNILFFSETDETQTAPTELSSPIVSGFDFSRPDLPEEITVRHASNTFDDLYRHPEVLKDASHRVMRYQKSHDIYSLGILLIEMAFWQPIEMVMGIVMDAKGARNSIRKIRETLLNQEDKSSHGKQSTMTRLSAVMGEEYVEVVQTCVQGGGPVGDAGSETAVKMQQLFSEEIMGKLRKIHV